MHKISTRVVCVSGKHPWISVVVSNCNMVMFWDAIASLIGYCEFGQQTYWSKFVSQNSHSTDQSLTIICPNSEMCIFCGALLYFCTKNKVVVVVVVCKHNEVSKKCRLLLLTLPPRISSTLFAITPHSFNCTVFIQWRAKTAKLHDCSTAYFSPDSGEGNTNFFQLLGKCMDAKPKQHNRGNIIFRRTLQDSKRSYVPVMNVGYSEALWRGNI